MATKPSQANDHFLRATQTVLTALATAFLLWIGVNVSHIPVIESKITSLETNIKEKTEQTAKRIDNLESFIYRR